LKKAPLEKRLRLLGVRAEHLCSMDTLPLPEQDMEADGQDQLTLGLFQARNDRTPG
jgi:hypothetical protein